MTEAKKTGLDLMREPFPAKHISKLPKPTRKQTDEVKADFTKGQRCAECGGWHHPQVVHLDYVGHAALTHRLLDCDPQWNWEPLATLENGAPAFDSDGGLWIKLTVCGVTRLGYGHPDGKSGGDAKKEAIGDALRNAAMRFGAALDLWHKGDLHDIIEEDAKSPAPNLEAEKRINHAIDQLSSATDEAALKAVWFGLPKHLQAERRVINAKDARKAEIELTAAPNDDLGGDEIPM